MDKDYFLLMRKFFPSCQEFLQEGIFEGRNFCLWKIM